jgi:RNA polymerase sigma factor (sigma-70 family)
MPAPYRLRKQPSESLSDFGGDGCLLGEMSNASDAQLLRDYVEHGREAAFRDIVVRHTDAVYSAALRQTGSPDLARDVAQSVFTDLARKASSLVRTLDANASLLGWLYRSTRFAALNQWRDDHRRQARERLAMQHFDPASESAPDWDRVGPVLDEAMADLSEDDREALLLRFFQRHDFRSIGQSLGLSDDAAQKRVSRALEKLRGHLTSRGVTTGAAALSVALSAHVVQAAPVGLAMALSNAALVGTSVVTTATVTAAQTIAMTTLQKSLIGATLAVAVGTGIYEARQASASRSQLQVLQQQHAPLAEQVDQLTRDRDSAANKLAALQKDLARVQSDNERLRREAAEVTKLRGEVNRLRAGEQQAGQANAAAPVGDDPFTQSVLAMTQRAGELNGYLQRMPEKRIPELQLLTENDWLSVAKDVSLQTEPEVRQALAELRNTAKHKFATYALKAVDKFAAANNGQLPAEISQLKPYFDVPVEDSMLERYQVLHGSEANDPESWVISENVRVDPEVDQHLYKRKYGRSVGG